MSAVTAEQSGRPMPLGEEMADHRPETRADAAQLQAVRWATTTLTTQS
jgi:hypothetical protein